LPWRWCHGCWSLGIRVSRAHDGSEPRRRGVGKTRVAVAGSQQILVSWPRGLGILAVAQARSRSRTPADHSTSRAPSHAVRLCPQSCTTPPRVVASRRLGLGEWERGACSCSACCCLLGTWGRPTSGRVETWSLEMEIGASRVQVMATSGNRDLGSRLSGQEGRLDELGPRVFV
jgi:hypothetical protein